MLAGWVHGGFRCRNELWGECATRALAHYRRAGMPSSTCIGHIAAAAYFGPMPSTAGARRCRELLEHDVDDRPGEANVLAHLGGLESMLGDFDAGFALVAAAREIYADIGRASTAARTCAPIEAEIALLMGDEEHARAFLEESCALLREQANWGHYGVRSSDLAAVLCSLGRVDEARQALDAAQPHVMPTDVLARVAFATASAALLMRERGRPAAEAAAREAVELAETSDASNRRAAALLALAAATEDESAVVRALQIYEEKENAAAASRLRAGAAASSSGIV
jgi:tetratricopeptide (TPR) repeat protein